MPDCIGEMTAKDPCQAPTVVLGIAAKAEKKSRKKPKILDTGHNPVTITPGSTAQSCEPSS
jgi:hypothetical protein